jgi:CDP-glucose 4,6-dehydratase
MHFLITGHTGFKGSWLSLMLKSKGYAVSGISLDPENKSLFKDAKLSELFEHDIRADIRDRVKIQKSFRDIDPDIVVHLAAQSLVRESYKFPVETFETNLVGTLNILEATREIEDLKATLIVTTDKVYRNVNQIKGYVESDPLGAHDPYSASKAAADLATQSWAKSFGESPISIARAGNVIGGGDWAHDRLIPDLVKSYSSNQIPTIRHRNAIRPWQHVLDCLNGYLKLIDKMLTEKITGEWNFGPNHVESHVVSEVVTTFAREWGLVNSPLFMDAGSEDHYHEAGRLLLDSTKSRVQLGWGDKLKFDETIKWTVDWYKKSLTSDVRKLTEAQINTFMNL